MWLRSLAPLIAFVLFISFSVRMGNGSNVEVGGAAAVLFGCGLGSVFLHWARAPDSVTLGLAAVMLAVPLTLMQPSQARSGFAFASMFYFLRVTQLVSDASFFRATSLPVRLFHVLGSFHDARFWLHPTPALGKARKRDNDRAALALSLFLNTVVCAVAATTASLPPAQLPRAVRAGASLAAINAGMNAFGRLLRLLFSLNGIWLPRLNNYPELSTSLAEFWTHRWDLVMQEILFVLVFQPLRTKRGWSPTHAAAAVFVASGVIHVYGLGLGRDLTDPRTARVVAAIFAYFVVQPPLLMLEAFLFPRRTRTGLASSSSSVSSDKTAGSRIDDDDDKKNKMKRRGLYPYEMNAAKSKTTTATTTSYHLVIKRTWTISVILGPAWLAAYWIMVFSEA